MQPHLRLVLLVLMLLFFIQFSFAWDVTLAWDPPLEAPDLAGYLLCYGSTSGQYDTEIDVGNVTIFTIAGLPRGMYYFAVKAYGKAGDRSDFSNEVANFIPIQPPLGGKLIRTESFNGKPAINIRLQRQSYGQGETVRTADFRILNPSHQSSYVEVKTWIALPGLSPIPLDLGAGKAMRLAAEFNRDYDPAPVLEIARDAPAGTCAVGARLLDFVTGDVLAEQVRPFTIAGKGLHSRMPAVVPGSQEQSIVLETFAGETGPQYILANRGASEAVVELKVWLEVAGEAPVPVLSLGAAGSLVLPAGAGLAIDPLASVHTPVGNYILKSRILNPVSGEILYEDRTSPR